VHENYLFVVLPLGIEPSSTALQTAAMTTSAKAALGYPTGIDPVLPLSQSRVQATTLRTPLVGDTGLEPVHGGIKIRCLTSLANPQLKTILKNTL
jgi:hypothetical protein